MTRPPLTTRDELRIRVYDAACAIRAEGHRASVARVRAWVTARYGGAGDQGILKDLVREVVEQLDADERAAQPAHTMPESLAARVEAEGRALWRVAVEAAEEACAERRRRADEEVREADGARSLAEDQLVGEQSRTKMVEQALAEAQARVQELERTVEALRVEVGAERDRAGVAERRAEEERRRLEQASARAEAAEVEARAAREEVASVRQETGERMAAAETGAREAAAEAAAARARMGEATQRAGEAAARAEAAERSRDERIAAAEADRDKRVRKAEGDRDAAVARAGEQAERADRRLEELIQQVTDMAARIASLTPAPKEEAEQEA